MKTYHYCVAYYEGPSTQWNSGVLRWVGDVWVDYKDIKQMIASNMSPPHSGDEIVVHSLTVIADDSR